MNVQKTFAKLMSGPSIVLEPKDVAMITAPVLVIHGTKDRNAAYAGGVTWSKSLPNAKLVTIEGAAHGLLWEEPERVLGAIREFVIFEVNALDARAERQNPVFRIAVLHDVADVEMGL